MRRIALAILCSLAWLQLQPTILNASNYIVVVVDDSGSMEDRMATRSGRVRRIDAAKEALKKALSDLTPDTEIGILALNTQGSDGNWIYPIGPANPDELMGSIDRLQANGGTRLGEFLKTGADALIAVRKKDIYGNYRLLVVTDGEANDQRLLDTYLPDIIRRGITIDVIGVDMAEDHSLATRVHQYRRADDAEGLQQALTAVFAETGATQDGDSSDFDLIAGLPDDFATEALAALSQQENEPIHELDAPRTESGDIIPTPWVQPPAEAAPQGNSGVGFGTLCCIGVLLGILVVGAAAAQGIKSGRRRR